MITSDLYFLHRHEIHEAKDLKQFTKEVFFVPETLTARNLLALFDKINETTALVVDEYGQISGLVTKEDIVEVVIGQIEDKRDEPDLYTKQGSDIIISSGRLEIATLAEIFESNIESEKAAVTVGGFLTEKLGDIPESGTKLVVEDLLFHVLSATPTRVQRVYIRKLKPLKRKQ